MRQGRAVDGAAASRRRPLRRFVPVAACLAVLLAAAVVLRLATAAPPFPLAVLSPPGAAVVAARNGAPLRLYLAPDEAWRFPTRLAAVAPILPRLVIAAEDRHFYRHPGVNPLSLARAAISNLLAGRVVSGGSTITMQLARLAEPKARTLAGKRREALAALALERRLSKEAILERYLNMAPYGGNIVGVGAASLLYCGKTPDRLSLAEAALFAVLPRAPSALDPVRHPARAKAARDALLARMARLGVVTAAEAAEAMAAPVPRKLMEPPFLAPQFSDMAREAAGKAVRVDTTLDPSLQKAVADLLRGRRSALAAQGIGAVAAVVLDVASRDVLALVGSTDFFGDARFGQINGATIRRSPGSALKPFLYAMALDAGLVFPQSQLLDVPTAFGGYKPKNYDGLYRGRVTTEQALTASLNVPAVRLLNDVGPGRFLDQLRREGFASLDRPAEHYGLSLVLGGGEVTLLSLADAYADLAGGGEHRPPRLLLATPSVPATRLYSPEASALVTEMLAKVERPDLPTSWERALAVPAVAWKTGTSYGHRDAWAVGYSADRVIAVWVGNMDGTPVKGISGAVHAGPILFELFRAVEPRGSRLAMPAWLNIREVEVCAESRQLAGPDCPRRVTARIIPGVTRLAPCPVHRRQLVDAATGRALSADCLDGREAASVVVARYPAELVSYWRAVGIPFEAPPEPEPGCGAPSGTGPRVVSPSPATPYVFRRDVPASLQRIALTAAAPADSRRLSWYVDGELTAQGGPAERLFWEPAPGRHRVVCVDDLGRTDAVTVGVE